MDVTKKKILTIESDPDTANLLVLLLQGFGAEVRAAVGGKAGIESARREKPDLVLVDLHLKDLPGLEVLHELRRTGDLQATQLAVLTRESTPGEVQEAAKTGIADFLVKADLISGAGVQRTSRLLHKEAAPPAGSAGRRALIVDDDESVRAMVKAVLSPAGADGVEAAEGADAIQSVIAHPPHLIALDLHLSKVDGLDVMRMIHAMARGARISTVVMTGAPSMDTVKDSLEQGAVDDLLKSELSSESGRTRLLKAFEAAGTPAGASSRPDSPGPA